MKAADEVSQAEKLYSEKASLYQKVFMGFLNWGEDLDKFFRQSNYLQPNLKVLDAGCGTGAVTKTLYEIAKGKGYFGIRFCAFDLTENMLKIFQQWVTSQGATNIELAQADVLDTKTLPPNWRDFDLIVTSTMLEYLPREKVKDALISLKQLLKQNGTLVVIITKRNLLTKWFAGRWWKANLYTKPEIQKNLQEAGFKEITFKKFTRGWSSAVMTIDAKVG
jgi:ubiquinone/menaquinone biosynthesis C-methylase UbiE